MISRGVDPVDEFHSIEGIPGEPFLVPTHLFRDRDVAAKGFLVSPDQKMFHLSLHVLNDSFELAMKVERVFIVLAFGVLLELHTEDPCGLPYLQDLTIHLVELFK